MTCGAPLPRLPRALCLLVLALLAPAAQADVVLMGEQHIGDNESGVFTPSDPVTLDEHEGSATRFHLSEAIVVTAIRLDGLVQGSPAPLAGFEFEVELDGSRRRGSFSGGTLTLDSTRSLNAGVHLIAIDPGCLRGGVQRFGSDCRNSDDEFDISFSSITLITQDPTSITLTRNLNRRRHLGDSTDASNDNFGGRWYPDAPEGTTLDIPFTLDRNLRLNEVRLYRLRDTASGSQALSRATLSIVNTGTGVVTSIGTLSGDGNPRTLPASSLLLAGNYVVRVAAGQMKSPTSDSDKTFDDLRWNDILLLFGIDPTATAGRFNSVDPDQNPVTGIVRTKVAGSPLDVDITAINNGMLLTSHAGEVSIKLLDASNDTGAQDSYGCRSSWVEREDLGTLTFTALDLGRKRLPAEVVNAYPKARLKITDTTLNISGCSTDIFAVRPSTFSLSVTHLNDSEAGTAEALNNLSAAVATPIHKAGQPFTIRATALNADGNVTTLYDSSPTVLAVNSVLGATVGEARADLWTTTAGVARTDVARYNEAGAFELQVADTSFAAVDAADTSADARTVGPVTISVGRFVPDHFEVTLNTPEFAPGCGAFTYVGQRFHYATPPVATLTAVAFAVPATTTLNYTGNLYKFTTPPTQSYSASSGTLDTTGVTDPVLANDQAGIVTVTLNSGSNGLAFTRSTPVPAFAAQITVTLDALADSDGVTTATTPVQFGDLALGTSIAFTGGLNGMRFGRLVVGNAHGSERLPLDVPLRVEYWDTVAGSAGFVTSVGDTCTSADLQPPASIVLMNPEPPGLVTTVSSVQVPTSGIGSITLSQPNVTGHVTVVPDLSALRLPWLRGDWDGNGTWSDDANDPIGRATFGVHKTEDRRIFQREVIGN